MKRRSNKQKESFLKVLSICLLLLVLSYFIKDNYKSYGHQSEVLNIYFFDVGQADSILINEGEYTALIDAGNNNDGVNLVNYIKNNLNISDIDIVFGTHPHEDHIGGLDDIINSFDIGKIYLPDSTTNTKTFEDVLDAIENKGYTITIPELNETFSLGDIDFKIIYTGTGVNDLNEASIVLKIRYKNNTVLFTGDAPNNVEQKILNEDIQADVLKVAHHGSNYSSSIEFLNKVNPQYAIISVGKNNSYNHPGSNTIKNLDSLNIKTYRTDKNGTILLTSDGNNINFKFLETNIDG